MKMIINDRLTDRPSVAAGPGYFYGYGVFETLLVKGGQAVFAEAHLERLNAGLKKLGINRTVQMETLMKAIRELEIGQGALKINVTEDEVVFGTRPLAYTVDQYVKGAKVTLSSVRRNSTSPSVSLKSMNYMDNLIVLKQAKDHGFQDAVFLNEREEVCETAVANLFIIKDDRLMTPRSDSGLLKGIVRDWVLKTTDAKEAVISYKDLLAADGIFMTNSLMGIMKIAEINGVKVADHPMTEALRQRYLDRINAYEK